MRFLLLVPLLLSACAAERDAGTLFGPAAEPRIVIDATLIVGRPLPDLFVRQTLSPERVYSLEEAAVTNASVRLSTDSASWAYAPDPDSAGRYLPPARTPPVQPEATYRLAVSTETHSVLAQTTTPARLVLLEAVLVDERTLATRHELRLFSEIGEQVYAAPENRISFRDGLLELRVEPSSAAMYQLALFNLEEESPFLIDEDFLEEGDADNFDRQGSSPPVEATDGRIRLPWFAIAFEGRHLARVYALDRNWYDYARSTGQGSLFGGLAGDEFEQPFFNVDGGIGLFGSAAVDSVGFRVLPRREE